jgi:hypothetical protein
MPQVSANQAPSGVLEKLRAIDPRARLVHLGGRSWWLGIDEPNNPAREKLMRLLADTDRAASMVEVPDAVERALVLERAAKEHMMYQIMAQGVDGGSGFRPIELREIATLQEFHELVEDFHRADWQWRADGYRGLERAFKKVKEAGTQLADRIQQDARSWWHHFMRRSTSFHLNPFGQRKGPTAPQED